MVDSNSFNDVFVTLPNNLEFMSEFLELFLLIRSEARKNHGRTCLLSLDIWQLSNKFNVFMEDVFLKDSLEFPVSIMLEDVFQRL